MIPSGNQGIRNYIALDDLGLELVYADGNHSETTRWQPVFTGQFVTPETLRKAYGVPSGLQGSIQHNSQSVAEFLGQFYAPRDLSRFFQLVGLPDYSRLVKLVGPNHPEDPGGVLYSI